MSCANEAKDDPVAQLPPLREVIAAHALFAKRSLGQNFLFDINLTRKIARVLIARDTGTIIEVGPGPGGLTRALLLEGAQKLVAIEKDSRAVEALASLKAAAADRLNLIEGDALKIDYQSFSSPRRIAANLPYNIATPLLFGWLEQSSLFSEMVLMFQKEVADRLVATVGSKDYGRLSVMAQWRCEVRRAFDLPPQAFIPAPKITSTVVHFVPHPERADAPSWNIMQEVVACAFSQRRKMLRTTLKPLGDLAEICAATGIDPTNRAETLEVKDFERLACFVEQMRKRG